MKRHIEVVLWIALLLAAIIASFSWLQLDLAALFRGDGLDQMHQYAGSFFPPDTSAGWLRKIGDGALDTLATFAIGALLAALAGAGLSLLAAARLGAVAKMLERLLLDALRCTPDLG